ncbi:hypothetical protein MKX01_007122 [Papaver californicum]|nr:hypothetical protein MKX01_007122 [Papaver californicum]
MEFDRDKEANIFLDQLMNSDEYKYIKEKYQDYIVFVYFTCEGISFIDDDGDDVEEGEEEEEVRYTSRDDILTGLKDILIKIPRDNMRKSIEHLQILNCCCGSSMVLVKLLRSPVIENKTIAKECIKLFLISPETNSGFFLPSSVQNQCATIILSFCSLLYHTTNDDKRKRKYFGIARTSQLIEGLYKFVRELKLKLFDSLTCLSSSPLESWNVRSLKRDFEEFALFSLHLRRAIEDHVKVKGRSLPFNTDDFEERNPYYLKEIYEFHDDLLFSLVLIVKESLGCWEMSSSSWHEGGDMKSNEVGSYLLSILKELHTISKLYVDGEEILSSAFQMFPRSMNYLILHSHRGEDHLWLLKYGSAIDFETRRNLIVIMFPEVKHDSEKLHKMLIDRSMLLAQSYERIAHVKARSLHNGLFVEFKDEVATGHGVLREWLLLVCQALFSPENSLFLDPAKVTDQQLKYFGFCGRVIALALMHRVQVGIAFDRVFFLRLAKEKISLEDIRCADPIMYRSCKKILEMDGDFVDSDAMRLTFVWEIKDSGSRETVELCPGGSSIVVNSKNREQYLKDLDCVLLGSNMPISVNDWKAHTVYEGFRLKRGFFLHSGINFSKPLLQVVEGMSMEQQRELLFFWTSVKYLPINGFSGLLHLQDTWL